MYLVSIYERGKPLTFQTVNNLSDLYRGLCSGLDVSKFNAMSNFNLFVADFNIPDDIENLLSDLNCNDVNSYCYCVHDCCNENLADSVYDFMSDNLNVYYDIVKQIDEFRKKIANYKLDK